MKTSELTGAQLDYWVARAEGYSDAGKGRRPADRSVCVRQVSEGGPLCCLIYDSKKLRDHSPSDSFFQPTVDWEVGGPIIERERICIEFTDKPHKRANCCATINSPDDGAGVGYGETPLIAAMRAYVMAKFSDEVANPCGGQDNGG